MSFDVRCHLILIVSIVVCVPQVYHSFGWLVIFVGCRAQSFCLILLAWVMLFLLV